MELCGFVDDIQMESMVLGWEWLVGPFEMSEEFGCERYVIHSFEAYGSKAYIIE